MTKISTKPLSGFRDFLYGDLKFRHEVFKIIREVYDSFGYMEMETPALESLDTLLGKYGEEGNQLIFKVLKRGAKFQKAVEDGTLEETGLADMGLRYDLTIPLARMYANNKESLPKIFKRYQIAPVWRADRPARGRYREFYQCDVDIVGTDSLQSEIELLTVVSTILKKLEIQGATIHVNNRKLLKAIMVYAGVPIELEESVLVSMDKKDKIGKVGVMKDLLQLGVSEDCVEKLLLVLTMETVKDGTIWGNQQAIKAMEKLLSVHPTPEGSAALKELMDLRGCFDPKLVNWKFDPFLARGLSYYTGMIFEIRCEDESGSLGGGGRYDDLIGMFCKTSVPACGFSLGVERILTLLENQREKVITPSADVLVAVDSERPWSGNPLANRLRNSGLNVELYLNPKEDLGKQIQYGEQKHIPLIIWQTGIGSMESWVFVKDTRTGEKIKITEHALAPRLREMVGKKLLGEP